MNKEKVKQITRDVSNYATNIALQMIDEIPEEQLDRLAPVNILKFALDKSEEIMAHRRDFHKPHPCEVQ